MNRERGAVLLESVLILGLLVWAAIFHLDVVRRCRARLRSVESLRLKYDGRMQWRRER